jgi:hypothetical protein
MTVKNLKNFRFADVVSFFDGSTTSFTVDTGQGARFGDAPFKLMLYDDLEKYRNNPAEAYYAGEAELLLCTAIEGDTLTVERAQEGSDKVATSQPGHRYRVVLDDTVDEEAPPE